MMSEDQLPHEVPPFAVLWDMDGVIVDSGPLHFLAWREALKQEGVRLSEEDFRRTFGQRNDTIIADLVGPDVPAERASAIGEAKERRYRALVRQKGIDALPGALGWIRRLHGRGVPQAIVSSAPLENITTILECLGATGFFQVLVSGEQVSRGKPDPESFLLAARQVGVPPERCVVVEDAPAGVEAARRAGMACLALTTSHPGTALAEADQVADGLAGLPEDTFDRLGV